MMKNGSSISLVPLSAALLLAVLYMWIPTCNYNFDSLMYASIVEAGYARAFVDTNRLFYAGFFRVLFLIFQMMGIPLRAIYLLQGVSLLSSVAILGFLVFWFRKRLNPFVSASLIVLLGVSSAWWRFSTDPHSHMVSLVPLVGAVYFWWKWLETSDRKNLFFTGILWYTAIVFHESHVLMGLVFLLCSKQHRDTWKLIGIVTGVVIASYIGGAVLHQSLGSWREFISFCAGKGGTKNLYTFDPLTFIRITLHSLFKSPWSFLFLAAAGSGIKIPSLKGRLRLIATWAFVYFFFFLFFEPINIFFRIFLLLPFVLLAGELLTVRPRLAALFIALAVFLQFQQELPSQIALSNPALNPSLVQAQAFKDETQPGDIILVNSEPDSSLKFYISYFGLRTTLPVDLLFNTHQDQALSVIDPLLSRALSSGAVLYFYKDTLEGNDIWKAYLKNWIFGPSPWPAIVTGRPLQGNSNFVVQ